MPTYKPISAGDILKTPETIEYEEMEYVVTLEPSETLYKTGKIALSLMRPGKQKFAWEVQYGRNVIDCLRPLYLDNDQARQLEITGRLTEVKIDELQNAHHFAEQHRRQFGGF